MNNISLEKKIISISKNLYDNIIAPNNLVYAPDVAYIKHYHKHSMLKVAVAFICMFALFTTTVFAFTGTFLFIPGLGPVRTDTNNITHSIGGMTEVEKDGYTHKIIYGYIENKRVYMELFYYKTTIGMTFDSQYSIDTPNGDCFFDSPVDYVIYYNGKKCGNYSKSYGTSISISYELPTVNKHETMILSLYSGDNLIANIPFYPAEHFSESLSEIPYAENNDIVLTADVEKKDGYIDVYISALLPADAYRDNYFFGNNRRFGFEESNVLVKDANGMLYTSKVAPSNPNRWDDEEAALAQLWHFHSFEIPDGINQFTIVVTKITYASGNENEHLSKTIIGPWEIPIEIK